MGLGLGMAVATAFTLGVDPHDIGVASALMNAVHQLGGAFGAAVLSSVAAAVIFCTTAGSPAAAATHTATQSHFGIASDILLADAITCGLLIPTDRPSVAAG